MANETLKTVGKSPIIKSTPQTEKAAKGQKKNAAGGYVFQIDKMERIKRFLILGSEKSFYQTGEKLTLDRVKDIEDVAKTDRAQELIDLIVSVSVEGRAPKQDPALFALALVIVATEDPAVKSYGYHQLDKVARTGTTLFKFAGFLRQLQGSGFGMGARNAFKRWYENKEISALAYQIVKYKNREGWSHADIVKLARPSKSKTDAEFKTLMDYTLGREVSTTELPPVVRGNLSALAWADTRGATPKELGALIREYRLSWEMVPSEGLNEPEVWEALLDVGVPVGALIRQLPRLTKIGVIKELGGRTQQIVDLLTNQEALVKARIHPLNLLLAQKTYGSGRSLQGFRATDTWNPNRRVVDALGKAFYLAFKAVEPTGKRFLYGLDVSGSMTSNIAGMPISSAEAVAAMALVTANVEPETYIVGFAREVRDLGISPSMSLPEVLKRTVMNNFGSTDCAAAIRYAREHKLDVDTFVIATDNDTWAGRQGHPHEELARYRRETGINAKMIVVATYSSPFSIADPKDPLTLDLVGFDTATPQIISAFSAD